MASAIKGTQWNHRWWWWWRMDRWWHPLGVLLVDKRRKYLYIDNYHISSTPSLFIACCPLSLGTFAMVANMSGVPPDQPGSKPAGYSSKPGNNGGTSAPVASCPTSGVGAGSTSTAINGKQLTVTASTTISEIVKPVQSSDKLGQVRIALDPIIDTKPSSKSPY